MSNTTHDNFLQAWSTFEWPEIKPVSYRCYYRDNGQVDFYTMEDLPGNYIEVTPKVFNCAPMSARVVDGQLQIIVPKSQVQKLTPGQPVGTACDPRDVCVVVAAGSDSVIWNNIHHEIN